MLKNVEIIAEVKTMSPFGWRSDKTWDDLFAIAHGVGDMLSIHTDARWGGSFDLLARARVMTKKPILAKGIHASDDDVERALSLGANWVLVVGRIPTRHAERCLIEPVTLEELRRLPADLRAVWNSRDLTTGGRKEETFKEARDAFPGWLCQASNIRTVADVANDANAVLVGTSLPEFAASLRSDILSADARTSPDATNA